MFVSCLDNKQLSLRIRIFVSVAWEKSLSLISSYRSFWRDYKSESISMPKRFATYSPQISLSSTFVNTTSCLWHYYYYAIWQLWLNDMFLQLESWKGCGTIQLRLLNHARHLLLSHSDYHSLTEELCHQANWQISVRLIT